MGRSVLASGQLGQHNGLPCTIIVSTTLQELESGCGQPSPPPAACCPCPPSSSWPATDRLYRSMKDLERLIDIADAARIQIRTVNGGDLDLSNSSGRMLARILGSVARQESEHKGERQRAANVQRAAAGKCQTANRPFGYTVIPAIRGLRPQASEPLEPEATAFRTAVTDVLAGKSIRAVAAEWNAKGLKTTLAGTTQKRNGKEYLVPGTWNSPRVRRLLMNPRYAGLKVHQGKVVGKGEWTPLIDEDTHHGLVAFLSDKSRIKCTSFVRKYLGSGAYICGRCGGPMRAAVPGGKNSTRTYECKAHQHVVRRGEPLDEYVEKIVLGYLSDPETRQRLAVMLHRGERVNVDELHTRRAALSARLEDLVAMFAAGDIDGNQLRSGTNELRTQLAGVNQVLGELSRRSPVADLLVADDPVEYWHQQSMDMKGKVLREICTVTVQPARRGARTFDYGLIDINPVVCHHRPRYRPTAAEVGTGAPWSGRFLMVATTRGNGRQYPSTRTNVATLVILPRTWVGSA